MRSHPSRMRSHPCVDAMNHGDYLLPWISHRHPLVRVVPTTLRSQTALLEQNSDSGGSREQNGALPPHGDATKGGEKNVCSREQSAASCCNVAQLTWLAL